MNTELLNAISALLDTKLDAKLEPIYRRLTTIETRLTRIEHQLGSLEKRQDKNEVEMVNLKARFDVLEKHIDEKFEEQAQRVDTLLEGWTIQKTHRRELDDHEIRITTIENRIPAIS